MMNKQTKIIKYLAVLVLVSIINARIDQNSESNKLYFPPGYVPSHLENEIAVAEFLANNNALDEDEDVHFSESLITSYSIDFENGSPGWSSGVISGRNTWAVRTTAGNGAGLSSNAYGVAHSGNGGMEHSYIQSPIIDMSGGGTITFSSWQCNENGYYDREHVQISYNGGSSWQTIMNYNDSWWTTQSSWRTKTLNVPEAFGTNSTRIRFMYDTIDGCCGCSGGWFIDNVVVMHESQAENIAPVATAQTVYGYEDEIQTITLNGSDEDGGTLNYILGTEPLHGVIDQTQSSVLDFDGSNDYVTLPDFSYLDDMSFSAWFKIDSRNYWERIFDFGRGGSGDIFLSTMGGRTNGNLELTIHPFGATYTINPGITCDDGEWHHVVFTYDKGGSGMVLYIDGQNVGSNSYNTHSFSDFGGGQNFYLGKANWNDPYYDGKMEDVGLFNKALSASEVTSIYNGGSNFNLNTNNDNYNSSANLIGYWRMDEGVGNTLYDDSGNENHATIFNGPNWLTEGSADVITYIPNPNYYGTDSFTFLVFDGELSSAAATVSINIDPVNDLPTISSSPLLDALEGHSYNYNVLAHDIDGDAITLTVPTKPDWMSINNTQSSLSFDGIEDYVNMGDPANLDVGSGDFTIKAVFKVDPSALESGKTHVLVSKRGYSLGNGFEVSVGNNGMLQAYILDNSGVTVFYASSDLGEGTEVSDGQWHTAYAVFDRDGNGRMYLDGVAGPAVPLSQQGNIDNDYSFSIGNNAQQLDIRGLKGNIEQVSLWNYAFNESDVQESMNETITGNEPGLLGAWNMDAGTGNSLTDLTGNGNDGTIIDATWSNDAPITLSGTPTSSDGGLHNVVFNIEDGNGGLATQSFSIGVAVTHLDITGESGFRILSSPVSGAIFGDLLEELWTQGSDGSDHEGADPNVWTYDNGWVPVEDLNNDVLSAGQGFVVYVFADTDFDGDDDLPVTIDIDGAINETAVSVTANPSQWNLVGNPYGLDVSINQILSDNSSRFNSTVYRLDDANPGYRTHNGTVGDIDQGLIKPFDGFWVQADTEGNIFEFTEQSIRRGSLHLDGGGRSTNNESTGTATFTFTNGEFTSNVYLSFTENGHINLDPADAKQIIPMSPAEHLTSMIHESGKSLSINNLPLELTTDISFDLDVMLLTPNDEGYETQSEQVTMTWDVSDLPEGISLSLVNNGTGQTVNLYGYPSMNVTLPSKGGFSFPENLMETYPQVGESQFTLSVYTDIASNEDENIIVPEDITLHNAYPNPFNPSTVISFDIVEMNDVSLKIFDLTGRQVASLINEFMIPGNHEISWNPGQLPSGVYLVELVVGDRSFNQKITYIK